MDGNLFGVRTSVLIPSAVWRSIFFVGGIAPLVLSGGCGVAAVSGRAEWADQPGASAAGGFVLGEARLAGFGGMLPGAGNSGLIALAAVFYPTVIRSSGVGWAAAEGTGAFIAAPYQFEMLPGGGHYTPDQFPERVSALMLEHLKQHPA